MGKYFSIAELTKSATAKSMNIDNTPNKEVEKNLNQLIDNILDPLREKWGEAIVVNSGYRCAKLNKLVGGASSSQHIVGQAADIRAKSNTRSNNRKLFNLIKSMKLPYDQLINEYNYKWIHVSYSSKHRRQILNIK